MNFKSACLFRWQKYQNEPVHEILVLIVDASSEGSDKPANKHSFVSVFAARIHDEDSYQNVSIWPH